MNETLFFEIPDDQEVMTKLVESVPSSWSWVNGYLHAPKNLRAAGLVQENTGFILERFHDIHPTIVGDYDGNEGRRKRPDLYAIMVEQKLPSFVAFEHAGFDDSRFLTLALAKRIAIGFLKKGYRGGLRFYSDCYDNKEFDNPAHCNLVFMPREGAPAFNEPGPQPSRIKVGWDKRYGGKEEDIAVILSVCRGFNLREYIPQRPEVG